MLRWQSFDLLATMVAVLDDQGKVLFVNAALEDALGISKRSVIGTRLATSLAAPSQLQNALQGVLCNEYALLRYDDWLKPVGHEAVPVHVIVGLSGRPNECIIEMLALARQARQEREERLLQQTQSNQELIRNLAHEIKNPLGGIRGAAQLLAMDQPGGELGEYTQVIVHEVDRLQALVDRLLEPQRRTHQVGDVNIHEVCEHVRWLLRAEYPSGLRWVQDYDTSIPEFRGDHEQLIQTVLNIARNACQAMRKQIAAGSACLTFRTRIARQITLGKQRYKLALELHVIDNGPGVPPALKEQMFYPLVSGSEGGCGLGLTLAQDFVRQHLGAIECDSEPGRTDFRILIPLP